MNIGYLDLISSTDRVALLGLGSSRSHCHGDCVLWEGDNSDFVVVLLAGRVKLTAQAGVGRQVMLQIRGPGDLIGQLPAISDEPVLRPASAVALEPVVAHAIPAPEFRRFLWRRPLAGYALVQELARDLRAAVQHWSGIGSTDTLGRLASRLVELACKYGQPHPAGVRIDLPLSQSELASWIGASRQAVVRALASLRARGLVTMERRAIVITDLRRLRDEPTGFEPALTEKGAH